MPVAVQQNFPEQAEEGQNVLYMELFNSGTMSSVLKKPNILYTTTQPPKQQ